jgi:hypothetical protein
MTKDTVGQSKPNVASAFLKGVVSGANGSDVTTAQVVGDILGAITPGIGELKSSKDVWEGFAQKDWGRAASGLIGLIPVLGDLGKVGAVAGKTGSKLIAGHGVQKGAQQISKLALKAASTPKAKAQLAKAAEHAGQLALVKLVDYLGNLQKTGEAPKIQAEQFGTFSEARDKMFGELGGKPDKTWFDLLTENDDGQKQVVGRHDMGERGFRIIAPDAGETGKDNPLRLVWWADNVDGKTPRFGLEQAPVSHEEARRIVEAYVNRDRSFRIKS